MSSGRQCESAPPVERLIIELAIVFFNLSQCVSLHNLRILKVFSSFLLHSVVFKEKRIECSAVLYLVHKACIIYKSHSKNFTFTHGVRFEKVVWLTLSTGKKASNGHVVLRT